MAKRKQLKPLRAKIGPEHPFRPLIDEAYRVFDYPAPGDTGVCRGCCMYPEIEADFFNPPIQDMPLHYLNDWFFAAPTSEAVPKSVWAYLLPRVLEVLAYGEVPASVGLEVSLNRFPTGDRSFWSDAEWLVLGRFQRAYLDRAFREGTPGVDEGLCMFGLARWPLGDLFAQVLAQPDTLLIPALWSEFGRGRPSIWASAFWDADQRMQVLDFYTSQAVYDRLAGFALAPESAPDLADQALAVIAAIEAQAEGFDLARPG